MGHANGKFKLRNPWGTNFTPNGADSITNGYTMQDGIFYVPDADVFKIFDQIDIEQLPSLDKTPVVVNGVVQKIAMVIHFILQLVIQLWINILPATERISKIITLNLLLYQNKD